MFVVARASFSARSSVYNMHVLFFFFVLNCQYQCNDWKDSSLNCVHSGLFFDGTLYLVLVKGF